VLNAAICAKPANTVGEDLQVASASVKIADDTVTTTRRERFNLTIIGLLEQMLLLQSKGPNSFVFEPQERIR
jgi:hypothetical protein